MFKNILLTGQSACGKSTLINEVFKELNLSYSGYRTLPYYINGVDRGYYLHGYVDVKNNFSPISVKTGEKVCYSVKETFEGLGCDILKKSREDSESDIILMDEIGVLEDEAFNFKKEIINTLNCSKVVIGVVKVNDNDFLNTIIKRDDTLILDLDKLSKESVKDTIISSINF